MVSGRLQEVEYTFSMVQNDAQVRLTVQDGRTVMLGEHGELSLREILDEAGTKFAIAPVNHAESLRGGGSFTIKGLQGHRETKKVYVAEHIDGRTFLRTTDGKFVRLNEEMNILQSVATTAQALNGDELEVDIETDPEVDMMSFVNAITGGEGPISLQDTPALLGSKYGENRSWFSDIFIDKDLTRRDQKIKTLIDQGYRFDQEIGGHDNPEGVVPLSKSEFMEQVTCELEELFQLGQYANAAESHGLKSDDPVRADGAHSGATATRMDTGSAAMSSYSPSVFGKESQKTTQKFV